MSEEKKDHQEGCCGGSPAGASMKAGGCGCGSGCRCGGGPKKFICGLVIGAFIFASGMWFAKSSCSGYMKSGECHKSEGMGKMCPMGGKMSGDHMMESK